MSKNEITDGVIFNPILNEFFWASKGKGAWCNNRRLRVSNRSDLSECLIGTGVPFAEKMNEVYLSQISSISKCTAGIRRLGSAGIDLAYVASGKIDGFWEKDLNLWDISTGTLLITEAGGKISNFKNQNWDPKSRDIIASNSKIHLSLKQKLSLL